MQLFDFAIGCAPGLLILIEGQFGVGRLDIVGQPAGMERRARRFEKGYRRVARGNSKGELKVSRTGGWAEGCAESRPWRSVCVR